MKIENIIKLRDRLNNVTEEKEINEEGNSRMTIRYDAFEEMFYLAEDGKEDMTLSKVEAKKLNSILTSML